jgi:hypothetical protein
MRNPHATSASLVAITLLVGALACCANGADDEDDERAEHAPPATRCPVYTRGGRCRAAGPKEVVTIASGGFLLPAAGFARGDGGFVAFSVRWSDARLLAIRSPRPWAFEAAAPLPWDATGATGVTASGNDRLYFVATTHGFPQLQVANVENGALDAPAPVTFDGFEGLPSWPQAIGLADGRVLLAFVEPQRRVLVGVDDGHGKRFRMKALPAADADLSGVLAHVGTTARGTWVLAYQVADPSWRFRSHVVLSADGGLSWSDAEAGRIAGDDSVSHPFPLARLDEGADVYYVRTSASKQVFRRALHEDGTLGREQRVTTNAIAVSNPQPRRLPDGRIALMLALEHSNTEKDLGLIVLDGDAPP